MGSGAIGDGDGGEGGGDGGVGEAAAVATIRGRARCNGRRCLVAGRNSNGAVAWTKAIIATAQAAGLPKKPVEQMREEFQRASRARYINSNVTINRNAGTRKIDFVFRHCGMPARTPKHRIYLAISYMI